MIKSSKVLYEQSRLPIFQNLMYESAELAVNCPKGDMQLVEDPVSGLIHNAAFDETQMLYDQAYQNEQGNSKFFLEHMETISDVILGKMGRKGLVEVGCGKGGFLELLVEKGVEICGFDPAYEGNSLLIQKKYFSSESKIHGKGIILRHVLEHVQNPVKFLQSIAEANGGEGLIYIEVPCFDWIVDNYSWFDIFYEHVNYFRISDFHRMFGKVLFSERTFGGQYLSIIADLSTLHIPKYRRDDSIKLNSDHFHKMPEELNLEGQVVVWGGASKGVIFSLFLQQKGVKIDWVVDINPAKHGKYLPGSGLKVSSPQEALSELPSGSTIYIMNPNYSNEIRQTAGPTFNYVEMLNDNF